MLLLDYRRGNWVIECEQDESDREREKSMTNPMRRPGGRGGAALLGAFLLLAGTGLPVLLSAGPAQASGCGSGEPAGTSCTLTGTLSLSGGTLTMNPTTQLGWTGTLTGLNQYLVDTTIGDQSYVVDDATGSQLGWHVTVSATQFTTSGSLMLSNSGTFSTDASTSNADDTTDKPTAACSTGATCTLPTNNTTYPVAITTGGTPTAYTIYDTQANSGLGSVTVGPVGWWLYLPANTLPGTYTSTVTLELISAP
jgi:hypothetical protein